METMEERIGGGLLQQRCRVHIDPYLRERLHLACPTYTYVHLRVSITQLSTSRYLQYRALPCRDRLLFTFFSAYRFFFSLFPIRHGRQEVLHYFNSLRGLQFRYFPLISSKDMHGSHVLFVAIYLMKIQEDLCCVRKMLHYHQIAVVRNSLRYFIDGILLILEFRLKYLYLKRNFRLENIYIVFYFLFIIF